MQQEIIDQNVKFAVVLNYLWGLLSAVVITIGAFIYYWYPAMITRDPWFKAQCPVTQYTSSTTTTGSATTIETAVNKWY